MNCGALAEGVLESELFGHEKGAFTGAAARRSGYFELANRGTLMLDEIGTTDHNFQIKLLRVLQDRLIYRVGSTAAVPVDVRIIAATNLDLSRAARDEGFRTDLYYRLSVVTLHLPPLRERREDIPLLAENFVRKYRHINPRVTGIAAEAVECLLGYDYPGNVRELENIIERGMILETGERLGAGCLLLAGGASNLPAAEAPAEAPLAMEAAEQEHIRRVLVRCGGKKTEAARVLGINKSTLWRKMKKFDLEV
jgi:transcriptional regulator with PAS, ATPase and Fis domain